VRILKWTVGIFALLVAGVFLTVVLTGLNPLRGPISRLTEAKTGRELLIQGNLKPVWSWVHPRIRAERISFANPPWAKEKYLITAEAVEVTLSVLPLFTGRVVLPEVHLEKPVVDLEQDAEGRKSWVLDDQPKKESRVHIHRLTLDHGELIYDDALADVSLRAALTTDQTGIAFTTKGKYHGLPLAAAGHGGPVLLLRGGNNEPFPLKGEAKIGDTAIKVDGSITELVGLAGIDMAIQLSGKSMDELYQIINVAFPSTPAYTTSGHVVREKNVIRYEKFTGKVGESDLSGTLEFDTGGARPLMKGDLRSKVLDLADLGPVVGTHQPRKSGVLPDAPFDAKRWKSADADVKLRAGTLRRPEQLPLDDLSTRIRMQDAVLTLDPLEFGTAGGKLAGTIKLDGREGTTIKGDAKIKLQKLQLSKLFPTVKITQASVGDLSGAIELAGTGNSVARLLGTSNGKIGLYMEGGRVSELIMQMVAIDLWGITRVKLRGDRQIAIRCVVGDFGVKDGIMDTNALVFDTEVVNISGHGRINLKTEELDLTLVPEPKDPSLVSLRTPLYIRGTFSKPQVAPDMKQIAAKGLGAAAMAIINPLLAVLPLVNEGEGKDSDCGKLIAELSAQAKSAAAKPPAAASDGGSRPAQPAAQAK
jgi:AsmA protein